MKRKLFAFMLTLTLCISIAGCGQIAEEENTDNTMSPVMTGVSMFGAKDIVSPIVEAEALADEDAGSSETGEEEEATLEEDGWVRVDENDIVTLTDDLKVQIRDDRIVKGEDALVFGETYGTFYDGYVLSPSEGEFYVLLEVWDYEQITLNHVLLYGVSEEELTLCQAIYGGGIEEIVDSSTVEMELWELDLGLVRTYANYGLDESTGTLVCSDEWKKSFGAITAEEKEIPVVIAGEETVIPVGSSIKRVETNLQGCIVFEIEETGERGELFYEKDESGRCYIGGESAGVYFKECLVSDYRETNLWERKVALEEAGEGGFAVLREVVEQGERYTYYITDYCDRMNGWNEKRVISVYDGSRLVQTIEEVWETSYSMADPFPRVHEWDINFDGVDDLVMFDCYTGNQAAALYTGYIASGNKFVECKSFGSIFNPRVDEEKQIIMSTSRSNAVTHIYSYYRYDGKEFVKYREDTYVANEEVGAHVMEDVHPFWNYMMISEDLSEEEWDEMQRFYPVFCANRPVHVSWSAQDGEEVKLLDEIEEDGMTLLSEFAFVDMTGDGQNELVMRCGDMGSCVLVLLEDDGEFYLTYFSVRGMQAVYEDGMYLGSGGGSSSYHKLTYRNGKFGTKTVAVKELIHEEGPEGKEDILIFNGSIDGKEVSYEEFLLWEAERMDDEVEWNAAVRF
ncbi:MAG: hypothetical protein J6A73_00590 [Lachnospiraceae bacterium]|nr:hypothetical protein [Lachnospiraceae bacterium]